MQNQFVSSLHLRRYDKMYSSWQYLLDSMTHVTFNCYGVCEEMNHLSLASHPTFNLILV